MQVILQPISGSDDSSSLVVETNAQATITSLISTFCTQRGIAFDSRLVILDGKERPLPQFSTLSSLGISNGQTLLISCKDKPFSLTTSWPVLVALIALIIGVVGILTLSLVYGLTGGKYPDDYGVIMDAGSSKTNTIVYRWRSDKFQGTGCVSQQESCKADGGIAEMDPMKLDPVINCAQKVTIHIDAEARPKTPLYFAATAGMRLLKETDPTKSDEILKQLGVNLTETGLSVKNIEIISGRDEGIYGWISANFLQQTLETPQKLDPWTPTTFGALDMGGASMQISYAVPETENKPDAVNLTLYGQTHTVFAHSDLCFGRKEAQRRYRYFLIKNPSVVTVPDPCLPRGYLFNMTGNDLFKSPCTNNTKIPGTYAEKYTFNGTSSLKSCIETVSMLLNPKTCKEFNFTECFLKQNNIPTDQNYLAFATYFFTTDFLNITKSTLEEYKQAADTFCQQDAAEIDKKYNITKNSFLVEYCFNAQYIQQVLLNGYGFSNDTWKNIQFMGKIADKDVGWTLGYMINATNLIPEKEKSSKSVSETALAVCLVLFIVVIIATLIFILRYNRKDSGSKSIFNKA